MALPRLWSLLLVLGLFLTAPVDAQPVVTTSNCTERIVRLRVGVYPDGLLVSSFIDSEGNVAFTGFLIALLDALLTRARVIYETQTNSTATLSYTYVQVSYPNASNPGSILTDLLDGTVDVYAGHIQPTVAQTAAILFQYPTIQASVPYLSADAGLLTKLLPSQPDEWLFLEPFGASVWGTLIASCLLVAGMTWTFERFSPYGFYRNGKNPHDKNQLNALSALYFAFLAFVKRNPAPARAWSTRFVLVAAFFLALFMVQSFIARLTSFFTVKPTAPLVKTWQDLATPGNQFAVDGSGWVAEYLQTSYNEEQAEQRAASNANGTQAQRWLLLVDSLAAAIYPNAIVYPNLTLAVNALKSGQVKALVGDSTRLQLILSQPPCTTQLSIVETGLQSHFQTIFLNTSAIPGFPLVRVLTSSLLQLSDSGALTQIYSDYLVADSNCLAAASSESSGSIDVAGSTDNTNSQSTMSTRRRLLASSSSDAEADDKESEATTTVKKLGGNSGASSSSLSWILDSAEQLWARALKALRLSSDGARSTSPSPSFDPVLLQARRLSLNSNSWAHLSSATKSGAPGPAIATRTMSRSRFLPDRSNGFHTGSKAASSSSFQARRLAASDSSLVDPTTEDVVDAVVALPTTADPASGVSLSALQILGIFWLFLAGLLLSLCALACECFVFARRHRGGWYTKLNRILGWWGDSLHRKATVQLFKTRSAMAMLSHTHGHQHQHQHGQGQGHGHGGSRPGSKSASRRNSATSAISATSASATSLPHALVVSPAESHGQANHGEQQQLAHASGVALGGDQRHLSAPRAVSRKEKAKIVAKAAWSEVFDCLPAITENPPAPQVVLPGHPAPHHGDDAAVGLAGESPGLEMTATRGAPADHSRPFVVSPHLPVSAGGGGGGGGSGTAHSRTSGSSSSSSASSFASSTGSPPLQPRDVERLRVVDSHGPLTFGVDTTIGRFGPTGRAFEPEKLRAALQQAAAAVSSSSAATGTGAGAGAVAATAATASAGHDHGKGRTSV